MTLIPCGDGRRVLVPGDTLDGADLSELTLHRAMLGGVSMRDARLRGADLRGADLHGADMSHSDLSDAALITAFCQGANMSFVLLTNARMIGGVFRDCNLEGAMMDGVDCAGATFEGALLLGSHLLVQRIAEATWVRSRYNSRTVWPEGFDPVAAGAVLIGD